MTIFMERGGALVVESDQYPDTGESGDSYEREIGEMDLWVSYRDKEDLERIVQAVLERVRSA